VKDLLRFTLVFCLLAAAVLPARAAFSSIFIFGDALSATADTVNPAPGGSSYYGLRWSNGRVWVEVLAQRQGLVVTNSNNYSYYDHNSAETVIDVNNFTVPPDVTNDLFIVWVCNADTFDTAQNLGNPSSLWSISDNIQSQINYSNIIAKLYADGVRTMILPNVVDLSEVPGFNGTSSYSPYVTTMHNGCVDYNTRFSNTISQARSLPGLTIYAPDFFSLLNNVLTNAAYYGLTNALVGGYSVDALSANGLSLGYFPPAATNGFGTNFVFWDPQDPTAKFHEVIADVVQQTISPVQIAKIAPVSGSNRLDIVNYPAGLDGFVDGVTNLGQTNWTVVQNFSSTIVTQSVYVPLTGPRWFYRLRFTYAWSWP